MPRINFVSFTFLFAFGLGSFVGIGMALLAVALARPADETKVIEPEAVAVTATPQPTATPEPTDVPPTPVPIPRTTSAQQVRIGPDEDYAVLGTLARGSEVTLQGRDDTGDWLAIEFPPGSSARGWIPADAIDTVTLVEIFRLDVLQASLIETSPRFPFSDSTPVLDGNDGLPPLATATSTSTVTDAETPTTPPRTTPTPVPIAYGPTDLQLGSVSLSSDGHVNVTVSNLGPGDVPSITVAVSADGLGAELLSTGVVLAGETAGFRTSQLQVSEATNVVVTVDPNGTLSDLSRGNNSRSVMLAP